MIILQLDKDHKQEELFGLSELSFPTAIIEVDEDDHGTLKEASNVVDIIVNDAEQ